MNATERLRRDQWHAFEMLHGLQLLAEEYWDEGRGARWLVGKPGTFVSKCEIIAGIGGSLLVHGDFDVVRFAHYGDHPDAWNRLCWMGLCTDVGYYVAQKASIGMGRRSIVEAYDEDVAKDYLEQYIAEAIRDDQDSELIEVLKEALEEHTGDSHTLRSYLGSEGSRWDLWERDPGKVVDTHVVIAHLAMNKLCALLVERHGAEGPPACRPAERRVA